MSEEELRRLLARPIHRPESERTAEGDRNYEISEIYGEKRWGGGRKVGSNELKMMGRMGRENK